MSTHARALTFTSRQFGMSRRSQRLVLMPEEPLGKTLDAAISIATSWPVEHGKNGWHCDGLDLLSFCNERRVIFRLELTHGVVVGKGFRVRNRHEVKTGVRRDSGEEVNGLSDNTHQCRNFPAAQFLQSALLVN